MGCTETRVRSAKARVGLYIKEDTWQDRKGEIDAWNDNGSSRMRAYRDDIGRKKEAEDASASQRIGLTRAVHVLRALLTLHWVHGRVMGEMPVMEVGRMSSAGLAVHNSGVRVR